jgi:hypothetical protein
MTPFFAFYVLFLIAPFLLFREPIVAAGSYPFAVLWMTMLTFMIVGDQFSKKYVTVG